MANLNFKALPPTKRLDFAAVNAAAMRALPALLDRWLPGGTYAGAEYDIRNPTRGDRRKGNFRVNVGTGRWADFAVNDAKAKGGDVVSLCAYLHGLSQVEAAQKLAQMLGVYH
jgi:hypothetical protein